MNKTVLELAMSHGLTPKREATTNGGEYGSACPFCGGKDRFRIWPGQDSGGGSYWCRRCEAHGDRIQFVMDTQKVGFKAACRITGDDAIAAKFASDAEAPYISRIPQSPRVPAAADQAPFVPRDKPPASALSSAEIWAEKAWKLTLWATEKLPGSEGDRLLEKKGIGPGTAKALGLGWIPEDIYRTRESWGLETVIKADTGKPKKLWIPKGLVIPHFSGATGAKLHQGLENDAEPAANATDRTESAQLFAPNMGRVRRLRIRRPEGEPRYYVLPGSDAALMILGTAARCVVVVESELDAILLDQIAGDIITVIAMGTSHARPDEAAARALRDALCLLVALDSDAAGRTSFAWWKQTYPRAVRWPVPAGKDPSDAHAAGVDLRAWVIAGWPAGWRMVNPGQAPAEKKPVDPDPPGRTVFSGAGPQEPTGPLEELAGLLKKNPNIRIINTERRLALQAPGDWRRRNESVFARISRLVYFEPEVFEYLRGHKDGAINCENLSRTGDKNESPSTA
jgi:hypothetical protein